MSIDVCNQTNMHEGGARLLGNYVNKIACLCLISIRWIY